MQAYLEPRDDGLFMREAGTWAREKLDYLKRYIDVFEIAMRKKWPVRCYVDLFAGPGKNVDRDSGDILLGSPLIALTATCPFTGYFFTDLSDKHTKTLRQRCTASPHSQRVQIWTGDCNDLVNEIVAQIKKDDWRSLNLAFLDPAGIDLYWKTVETLAQLNRMDLVIHYPQMGLGRAMPQVFESADESKVDLFFGGREWREIYGEWKGRTGLHRRLIDHYKEKLRSLGYVEVLQGDEPEPLIRNEKRRAPLYRLIFASKHRLGHNFWRDVTSRDVYGQRRLL